MRTSTLALALLASALASAQTVTSVYNRDTHEPFKLKTVKVQSTVVGPMVRTSTLLTYHNPYLKPTEATLNFEMPAAAALGGFAYFYGSEYVKGRLMDKAKAWAIYTAITSRNRDPGIMEQWSPTTYHCQIYPIKKGHDLRIKLWTVGMLKPKGDKMALPKPQVPRAVGYEAVDSSRMEPEWSVRSVKSGPVVKEDGGYSVAMAKTPVRAVAQRFKDGRVYVAGFIRPAPNDDPNGLIVDKAVYEPLDGLKPGIDATEAVRDLIRGNSLRVGAFDQLVGDPEPYHEKRLHIEYRLNGQPQTVDVKEYQYFAVGNGAAPQSPTFQGLKQVKTVGLGGDAVAFSGWAKRNGKVSAHYDGQDVDFRPEKIAKGSDTARLWAQQMLATNELRTPKDQLKFSMKYGVPSTATALLAVPQEEMKLFREKEAEFNKSQAEQRRQALEAQRKARNWTGDRNQNWNSGGGGDPEIRVVMPGAQSVEAILPDRRVIPLKADGDVWGGNFEIPADAAEGTYPVRVVARMDDGTTVEKSWTYDVDRTAPMGKAELLTEAGRLILQVKAEAGLKEVAAYAANGDHWVLREETPGVYRIELPTGFAGALNVILKDRAGNKGEIACSPQP